MTKPCLNCGHGKTKHKRYMFGDNLVCQEGFCGCVSYEGAEVLA